MELLLSDGLVERLPNFARADLSHLEASNSYTMIVDDFPVLCGGTIQQWSRRHVAWSFLNRSSGPHMLWLTRVSRGVLDAVQGRIEMTVRCDFRAGHRWAQMLGFYVETECLSRYGPEGEPHTGYVRHNNG